ncbi:MAG: HNH endonuclease [Gemmatimonadales bacterium]
MCHVLFYHPVPATFCQECTGKRRKQQLLHKNHVRRARLRSARVQRFDPIEIYRRDGWRCGLCGERVSRRLQAPHPRSASLDHIRPLADGGDHVRENVHLAHRECNEKKSIGAMNEQLLLVG